MNCEHCGAGLTKHCPSCDWSRCSRCFSYGTPNVFWRLYDKGATFNLMTMKDVQVADTRELPTKRKAIAGYTD